MAVTLDGKILGTPAYMAPEQAAGNPSQVGAAADIYALGVILYEMLTGEPPFRGNIRMILHQVLNDEPRPPRRLNDRIPRDLETICLKAMAKEPSRRYGTAGELSADLRRYLNGQPIQARPVSNAERFWCWCRRNPLEAGLTAAVTVLILTIILGSIAEVFRLTATLHRERELISEGSRVRTGLMRLSEQDSTGLLYLLDARKMAEEVTDRQEAWSTIWSGWYPSCSGRLVQVFSHEAGLNNVVFSPDGKLVATASQDGTCRLWDVDTGKPYLRPFPQSPNQGGIAFSPDGKFLATLPEKSNPQMWEVSTGKSLDKAVNPGAGHLIFNPDKKSLIIVEHRPTPDRSSAGQYILQFWDMRTWLPYAERNPTSGPLKLSFSPNGKMLAVIPQGRPWQVWDTATAQPLGKPIEHKGQINVMAWSSDSKQFATGTWVTHTARIWDPVTGEAQSPLLPHPENIHAIAFTPDGKLLATGCYDGVARLWDTATGELRKEFHHEGAVLSLAIGPDGRFLATGSADATARLWEIKSGEPHGWPLRHQDVVNAVAFSGDGKTLATASRDGTARLWDVEIRKPIRLQHEDRVWGVAFHPDGKMLATGSEDHLTCLWDISPGKSMGAPVKLSGGGLGVAFSPDGKLLAGSDDSVIMLWETENRGQHAILPVESMRCIAFIPNRKLLACAGGGSLVGSAGKIGLLDTVTGKPWGSPKTQPGGPQGLQALSVDPTGRFLAVGSNTGLVQLWDIASQQPKGSPLRHGGAVDAVAFSSDGQSLAVASGDQTVRFWDPETGQANREAIQQTSVVQALAFSPDGKILATASTDGSVRMLELTSGLPFGPAFKHTMYATSVAFSPDGNLLASGSFDKTARLWPVPPMIQDRKEMELRTWVALGARLNDSGTVEPIPWREWQKFRDDLLEMETRKGNQK